MLGGVTSSVTPAKLKGRAFMPIAIKGILAIGVRRTFATGRLQMFAALDANFNVFVVSSKSEAEGERHTIIKVKALPPSESYMNKFKCTVRS
jgi:hypothetical protein